MTSSIDDARDDLAFMRALVQAGDNGQRALGEAYFAGGLSYGLQILLSAAMMFGWLPKTPALATATAFSGTIIFLPAIVWVTIRNPKSPSGLMARAVATVFGAVGITNLALIAIIGSVALRDHSLEIWLIYPCTVMVLQGLGWLVAYALRRSLWLAVVSIGWFATGIAMALAIKSTTAYVLVVGFGLFAFMMIPGLVLMRQARRAA